jgi:hypothetical protein
VGIWDWLAENIRSFSSWSPIPAWPEQRESDAGVNELAAGGGCIGTGGKGCLMEEEVFGLAERNRRK